MLEASWPWLWKPPCAWTLHRLYIFCWILLVWGQIPHFCCKIETVIILSFFSSSIYYIQVFNTQFLGLCFFQIIYHCLVEHQCFPLRSIRYVSCSQQNPNILKNSALTFGTVHIISYRGLSTHYILITIMQWKVWEMFALSASLYTLNQGSPTFIK